MMKLPNITPLHIPGLLQAALRLPAVGILKTTDEGFAYLDIEDDYIHQLFPLLKDKHVEKPDYFDRVGSVGAHISVIYPEEGIFLKQKDIGQEHSFSTKKAVIAEIGLKKYYVILVESSSLLQLRRKQGLPDVLCFHDYAIHLHITIGFGL